MRNCVFCDVHKTNVEKDMVYQNKYAIAFMDYKPMKVGHVLVIPKKHVENFYELGDNDLLEFMRVVRKVAKGIKRKFKPKKVGMFFSGFSVPHMHAHLIPLNDDHEIVERSIKRWKGKVHDPSKKRMGKIKRKIRGGMKWQK